MTTHMTRKELKEERIKCHFILIYGCVIWLALTWSINDLEGCKWFILIVRGIAWIFDRYNDKCARGVTLDDL